MNKTLKYLAVIGIFFLLAYPSYYHEYKYGDPAISGQADYYEYYKMYKDLDFEAVAPPTNMRVISALVVHAIYKSGIYYPVEICFSDPNYDQQVYFSAVMHNFLAGIITCFLIFLLVFKYSGNYLLSILMGAGYLLDYSTVIWGSGGAVDGFSVMVFTIGLFFLLKKSYWIIPLIVLTIFQRDVVLIAFGVFTFVSICYVYLNEKKISKFNLYVFLVTLTSFIIMVVLRETVFHTSDRWSGYTNANFYSNIFDFPDLTLGRFLRGVVFSQNTFLIFLIFLLYKIRNKIAINKEHFLQLLSFFIVMGIICVLLKVLHETGRYFNMASSAIFVYLGFEIHHFKLKMKQKD